MPQKISEHNYITHNTASSKLNNAHLDPTFERLGIKHYDRVTKQPCIYLKYSTSVPRLHGKSIMMNSFMEKSIFVDAYGLDIDNANKWIQHLQKTPDSGIKQLCNIFLEFWEILKNC